MKHRPQLIAFVAGIASATGFVPLHLWAVTLVALAVLMVLILNAPSLRAAFARGGWFGVGHFALGLNWIAHAFVFQDAMPHWLGYIAVGVLSLYLAVYPAFAAAAAWLLGPGRGPTSRGAFSLIFAGSWILAEYGRATLFSGFAWNPLAAIAVGVPAMGYARFVGTYGLSGIMICAAGILWWLGALAIDATRGSRRLDSAHIGAAAAAIVVLILLYLGVPTWTLRPALAVRDARPAIRVIQHNTSQAERHDENHDEASVRALERLTGPPGKRPRLILWPEAAIPYYLEDERWARYRLARLLGPGDVLLTGGESLTFDRAGRLIAATNSLYAMTAQARLIGRYDKAHLVPYGEYLPMREFLSAIGLSRLVPGDLDFAAGPGPRTLALPGFGAVGGQICYEIVFSGQVVDRAHRPDFIFNPSTDAWFGWWGPPQHMAQARLRAIEEGIPVIRSTPTGISAVIDADGRLIAKLPANKPGFITSDLPTPHPPTLFARYGNILPIAFALILLAAGIAPSVASRRAHR